MKVPSIFYVVCFFLFISSCGYAGSADDDKYNIKMIENLNTASLWLIEEGVHTFRESGKNGIHRKLVDEWGVQIWVDPWIESERYVDGFWIKARGINHEVINLYREKVQDELYEFWVVKVDSEDWSEVGSRSEFFVAKTNNIYGKRKIIIRSDQFIEAYEVDDSHTIKFPQSDLDVLYELQAWRYPDNYKNSKLKNDIVELDISGNAFYKRSEK